MKHSYHKKPFAHHAELDSTSHEALNQVKGDGIKKTNKMKKSPTELLNLTFSGIMILVTIIGSIVFFFTDLMTDRVFGNKRYILGSIFFLYAIYRSYRVYTVYKTKD